MIEPLPRPFRRRLTITIVVVASGAAALLAAACYVYIVGRRVQDMASLPRILFASWAGTTLVAAVAGQMVARRTLSPVLAAAKAAASMAQRLLGPRDVADQQRDHEDEFATWAGYFNELGTALEANIAALRAALAHERRFTADVAHELQTPLTALVAATALMDERLDELSTDLRRPAEIVVADVGRMQRLVEDLLELAGFDAGQQTVQIESVDLAIAVADLLRSHGWDDVVEFQADQVTVPADRRRLDRIVVNLVANALTHGGAGVSVQVRAAAPNASVVVSDRGPGIAPQHLPHLFDRFYKADAARTMTGSGLGLAVAQQHARLMGGMIEASSVLGVGTQFTVRLPLNGAHEDDQGTSR